MGRLGSSFFGWIAIALLLMGCGGGFDRDPAPDSGLLEVGNWWIAPSERQAFEAMLDVFRAQYPGVVVKNAATPNDPASRAMLANRIAQGIPPDSFQTLGGVRLQNWVTTGSTASLLEPLDDLYREQGWKADAPETVFHSKVVSFVQQDGHFYCVPVNIERENNLYCNLDLFNHYGLTVPETLNEYFAAAAVFKANHVTPLALAADDDSSFALRILFQVALLTWPSPSTSTPTSTSVDDYEAFFSGESRPSDDKFRGAFELFLDFLDTTDADLSGGEDWTQATEDLANGTAAMFIHGDWVSGELIAKNKEPDHDFRETPAPGTKSIFLGQTDCFTLLRGLSPQQRANAKAFLGVVGSPEAQDEFNQRKGSIPARLGTSALDFPKPARTRMSDIEKPQTRFVRSVPGLVNANAEDATNTILANLRHDYLACQGDRAPCREPAIDTAIAAFEARHPLFHR